MDNSMQCSQGWKSFSVRLALMFALVNLGLGGCSIAGFRAKLAATTSDQQGAIGVAAERLTELDQATYSFADRYVTLLSDACDKAAHDNPEREAVKQALRLKLHNASSAYAIATGPNPLGQLLDLATIVTLNKIVYVDERNAVSTFGNRHPVIEQAFNAAYEDIWTVARRFLQPAEIEAVKKVIGAWRRQHPEASLLAYVRFDDFSRARAGLSQETPEIGGLFDRINQVQQTMQTAQQFGERALFYAQRFPRLLQWQTERTVEAVFDNADLQKLQASVQDVSKAATVFADEVKQFDRKQAAIQESLARVSGIIEQIDQLAPNVSSVLQDSQRVLLAAHEASIALDGTLGSAEKLSSQFLNSDPSPAADKKPFDINEYTRSLAQLSDSLQRAQGLVQLLQAPDASQRIEDVRNGLQAAVDHIVWRLAELLLLALVLAIIYKLIVARANAN